MKKQESRLGRGLGALIDTSINTSGSSSINEVELSLIHANPNQPRSHFDEEALDELASSIRELGVISPITLRKNVDGTYLIIAGERRYRASKQAGLKSIPAYVKTAEDEQVMEMALIENIQREDLNAIEIALAFQTLIDKYNLTQEKLSERIGKKRATIANFLRILKLPAEIQIGLKDKKIDLGHAKALLSLDDPSTQLMVYEQILEYNFSVRRTEEIVKELNRTEPAEAQETIPSKAIRKASNEYNELKNQLSSFFGVKVSLSCDEKCAGKVSFSFKNEKELQRIIQIFDSIKSIS